MCIRDRYQRRVRGTCTPVITRTVPLAAMYGQRMRSGMGGSAPSNYVAGVGRGATGFTTRSDIGPSRQETADPAAGGHQAPVANFGAAPAGYQAGAGRGLGGREHVSAADRGTAEDNKLHTYADEAPMFMDASYEEDDLEADQIWKAVDGKMDQRRKQRREEKLRKELGEFRKKTPKISEQFTDLKRDMQFVSMEEWENIPEVGDNALAKKRKRTIDSFLPNDTLLKKAQEEAQVLSSLDPKQQKFGGLETPLGMAGGGAATPMAGMYGGATTIADLTTLGSSRSSVLGVKLDQVSDSVTGQTVVDPKGYLTDLNSMKVTTDGEVSDIKRCRLLLQSVMETNPRHPPAYIASARLEEVAGKLVQARKIMELAMIKCGTSEDVYLEAARLNTPENAKGILAQGVKAIPQSIKLWLRSSSLESDGGSKRLVLRKALEVNSTSVKLWMAAIEHETDPDDARVLLARAVECVPHSTEMWLALARLESYDNARKVLNMAREKLPAEVQIWISAAQLEEANGNAPMVNKIVEKSMKTLKAAGVQLDRESWLNDAEQSEKAGSVATAQALVRVALGIGVEDEDRKSTWLEDCETFENRQCYECARAAYAHMLAVFAGKKSIWIRAANLERHHGTPEALNQLLMKAVGFCPKAEILWLMAAKERWNQGDVTVAREILESAFRENDASENIWLAAVKLESSNNEHERATLLLQNARNSVGTEKIWKKSITLEKQLGNKDKEMELLTQALAKFPNYDKLWILLGQHHERNSNLDGAREAYTTGTKNCSSSTELWILYAQLEERNASLAIARSVLEKGRIKCPKNPDLWLEAIRLEERNSNLPTASALMAKALQDCSDSGKLWAKAIEMEPHRQKKAKSVDALKKCDSDPHVMLAVAKLFWMDGKMEKARSWFNRTITLDADFGDAWVYFYKFEVQRSSEDKVKELVRRCVQAEPGSCLLYTSPSPRDS
eukprot:TRINITY_DN2129_c0_g1_i16.p1 TRINITY_DN2129_c0_g1~~TRINITY_DN2129_c0_g1_i16.p1  ORF type:complete len:958 (+),score=313.45 TRINITY_DN2129_c0_g1_i16:184-3057(+)